MSSESRDSNWREDYRALRSYGHNKLTAFILSLPTSWLLILALLIGVAIGMASNGSTS